jgi:hypothetical protein
MVVVENSDSGEKRGSTRHFRPGRHAWRASLRIGPEIALILTRAAAIYLAGAIGVEMLSGLQADLYGEANMGYALITTAEELLEMLGIVVLITALLNYLPTAVSGIRIWPGSQPTCVHISSAGSPACTR